MARERVPATYGFVNPADCDGSANARLKIVQDNRELVEYLKFKSTFAYQVRTPGCPSHINKLEILTLLYI